jgi:hypothetical protein
MMKSTLITTMTLMSVTAVPMSKEAHLDNLVSTLFNGPQLNDLTQNRVRRAEDELDMCSYRMQNITRLADVAGAVFMSVDDSPLYRKSRNHISFVDLEQPVGRFCMKLWKKLVKVHGDLQTLSRTLHEYNFVSRSVEYLIEALQEQMNIENVTYDDFEPSMTHATSSRLNMDLVRERSQVQLSHIVNELKSLEQTCTIRRKRMVRL